jgi:hypothetical protein
MNSYQQIANAINTLSTMEQSKLLDYLHHLVQSNMADEISNMADNDCDAPEVEVVVVPEVEVVVPPAPVLHKCEECGAYLKNKSKSAITRHNKSMKHLRAVAIANPIGRSFTNGWWLRNSILGEKFPKNKIDDEEVVEISFYDFSFDKKYKTPQAWEGRVWYGCEELSNFIMFDLYNTSSPFAMELSNVAWEDEYDEE